MLFQFSDFNISAIIFKSKLENNTTTPCEIANIIPIHSCKRFQLSISICFAWGWKYQSVFLNFLACFP